MTLETLRRTAKPAIYLTSDDRFARRIRRLVVVSSVALGAITMLAVLTAEPWWPAIIMLALGWIGMPLVLLASLGRPSALYSLTIPAFLVFAGVTITALGIETSGTARTGWWLMTVGVGLGGVLGGWLWYRWLPVPAALQDPFAAGRWSLIGLHAGLVVCGALLAVVGAN